MSGIDRIHTEAAQARSLRDRQRPTIPIALGPLLCKACLQKEYPFRTSTGSLMCSYCGERIKEPSPTATLDTLAETLQEIKKLLEDQNG